MKKLISIGSDCSGVGAFSQALNRLGINYEEYFACDFDYYARCTYLLNFGTKEDIELSKSKLHKFYSDAVKKIALLSDKEIENLSEEQLKKNEKVLDDANEFGKKFSFYYPFNMYQREVPNNPLDVYCSTVPCQAFSLAGKRLGKGKLFTKFVSIIKHFLILF